VLAALIGALSLFAAAPAQAQTIVWSGTLTVQDIIDLGCSNASSGNECSSTSVLTDDDFTHDDVNYAITNLFIRPTRTDSPLALVFDKAVPSGLQSYATLHVGSAQFHFANDAANAGTTLRWDNPGLSWSVGDSVSLSITIPTVTLSASPNPVLEGSSVTVTATLSRALSSNVTIPVTLMSNSAESGDHGTLSNITINSGSTSGTGMIMTNHDTDEDDETFTVELDTANLPSGITAGTQSSVQITIRDDEGIPTVSLSADPNSVREGENVTVTATLSEALSHYVQIPLLPAWNTGTVEQGDIKGPPGTISVHSGSTTGETIVLAVRDCDTEDEEFIVRLNTDTLPSSLRAGTQTSVTVTIEDDGDGEWCDSRPPQNTGGTTTGGGGGGFGGGGNEPPPEDEEPTASCPREDRETLVSFYEMTDGENWNENENWNSEEPLREWHGIETDEDGNVVYLRLSDNNLSGDMPTKELLCLTELVELALWDNDGLSGEVPDELVLAVERAALRYLAEMLDINPEWFENYEDPYDFEDWHEGVTTDDDGRVTGLDLTGERVTGEIPENIFELLPRLGEVMITRSSGDGGCALSPEGSSAFSLFLLTLFVFAVLGRKRARRD